MAAPKKRTRGRAASGLTHVDEQGAARMVDVADKAVTRRRAVAEATVRLGSAALRRALRGDLPKGGVFAAARLAGIQAAKRTWELIPLCHPVPLTSIAVDFARRGRERIVITAEARATDRTGVEMEALVAVSIAALTVYDMLKAVERGITISTIRLVEKEGGASGRYLRSSRPRRRGEP
ncbi:MAG: cyclic pyranopterin monophosphate synthase MoaC [Planctomycetes bacterium]|nr:cyclic pyranopterin monophosphate synthase MoaC [Planctomycetota bacterium]